MIVCITDMISEGPILWLILPPERKNTGGEAPGRLEQVDVDQRSIWRQARPVSAQSQGQGSRPVGRLSCELPRK